ncbi:Wadjet anti-phage system protein JetD domain-containing protein [Streptomyces sp. NBC_00343]|uniref:Wadjet anti-phage system protein JetD domain-containing protein n=1 Tax=Streptomyces sp. NBC_00343 TaxID=2975719 RepID=UPI002E2C280C|nr:Wadjet anti-phage system protein JetD domain-containing protein [Streptomyces sp. NBC_00343]
MSSGAAGSVALLFGEAEGRIRVSVAGIPNGTHALSVPVRRQGSNRAPRNRRGLLRITEVDLITATTQPAYQPPKELGSRDLIWVLSAKRRTWTTVTSRFGSGAWNAALSLVRSGGVVLRCAVDEDLEIAGPLEWRLSHSWALQADELLQELRGWRDPDEVRKELLALVGSVAELDQERVLLDSCAAGSALRVPEGSAVATDAWTAYEAALRAAAEWWPCHREGQRMTAKELAGLALSGSKMWTPARQAAFENLIGMSFDVALDEADVDIRVRGALRWRVGTVAADASAANPWIALPAGALRLVGEVECGACGIFLVENSDTFERVCAIPEITSQWLCIWGHGYVANKLVALLEWLRPERLAIWGDLDADGIAIVDDLSRRLGRKVHAVGMEPELWRAGPYRYQKPEAFPKARALAAKMAAEGPVELRALAAEIAGTGESCEQEPLHKKVLPRLVGLLSAVPADG